MLVPLLLLGLAASQNVWQLADQDVVQDFSTSPTVLVASIPCAEQVTNFTLVAWVEHETLPTSPDIVKLSKTPLGQVQAEVLKVDGTYTSLTIEGAGAQKWEEIVLAVSSNTGKLTLCTLSWQGTPTCSTSYSGNQFPSFDTGKSSLRLGAGEVGPSTQGKITNVRVITAALTDSEIGKLSAEHRCESVSGVCEGPASNADPSLTTTSSQPICLHTSLPTAPEVPLDSQSRYYETSEVTGSVSHYLMDIYAISIKYTTTTALTFRLTVFTGDADLYVFTYVNGVEHTWYSSKVGSDVITLLKTNSEFAGDQGNGLKRDYAVGVKGYSSGWSSYQLSVEVTYTNQWNSDAPITAYTSEVDAHTDLNLLQNGVQGMTKLLSTLHPSRRSLETVDLYGSVVQGFPDFYRVQVLLNTTTRVFFNVTAIAGDPDLFVSTFVNNVQFNWSSTRTGSDQLTINRNDWAFESDPLNGLKRDYIVTVKGFSSGYTHYILNVQISFNSEASVVEQICGFQEDGAKVVGTRLTQAEIEAMKEMTEGVNEDGRSYAWVLGAVALLGLGVWAYLKKEAVFRKGNGEGEYLLVHSA